jgi:hypothetical protein
MHLHFRMHLGLASALLWFFFALERVFDFLPHPARVRRRAGVVFQGIRERMHGSHVYEEALKGARVFPRRSKGVLY